MKIRVKFFALYRQITGKEEITLQVPSNTTVSELQSRLLADFPQIARASVKPLIAVNAEYAGPDQVLEHGDTVALLPPFSGGVGHGMPCPVDSRQ